DRAGRFLQAHRPARVSHGADPSPLREARLDRGADRHPLLDHRVRAGSRRSVHPEAAMIPVTIFAGKKLAVFGLGASGLATCHALMAGGAEVVAFDDDAGKVAQAAAAGVPTADLRQLDWSGIAAFVLTPGVPLTHPAPHWSVGLARNAAVEVIGDIELYCRQRRATAPDSPFVAITGTNGKSTTTALVAHVLASAGYAAERGGNIGTAILSLAPPHRGHAHVIV